MENSGAELPLGSLPPRHTREGQGPKRRWGLSWVGCGIGLIGFFAATIWIGRAILPAPLESVIVVDDQVEIFVDIEALVVRDERVALAPTHGRVKRLVSDGERVRLGADVLELTGEGVATPLIIKAEISGVVHFEIDGLEGHLTPTLVNSWSFDWFSSLPSPLPHPTPDGPIQAGQPPFKVVDSLSRGLIAVVDPGMLRTITPGRRVGLRIGARDSGLYPGRLSHIHRGNDRTMVFVMAEHLPDAMSVSRKARVSLVLDSIPGKVVPRTAIDVRRGVQGVWSMEAGQTGFVPIRVVGGNATLVVVEAQIPSGTRIRRFAPTDPE